jgi:hypothetical protein
VITFSVIDGDHFYKQNDTGDAFKDITVRAMGAPMRNDEFVDTGFIRETDFIAVGYLALNNGLTSNRQFSFHANIVQINLIRERLCNIFHRFHQRWTKLLPLKPRSDRHFIAGGRNSLILLRTF